MPSRYEMRSSVSRESAPARPSFQRWNVERERSPSSVMLSRGVSLQACAMRKNVRSRACADSRVPRSTAGAAVAAVPAERGAMASCYVHIWTVVNGMSDFEQSAASGADTSGERFHPGGDAQVHDAPRGGAHLGLVAHLAPRLGERLLLPFDERRALQRAPRVL